MTPELKHPGSRIRITARELSHGGSGRNPTTVLVGACAKRSTYAQVRGTFTPPVFGGPHEARCPVPRGARRLLRRRPGDGSRVHVRHVHEDRQRVRDRPRLSRGRRPRDVHGRRRLPAGLGGLEVRHGRQRPRHAVRRHARERAVWDSAPRTAARSRGPTPSTSPGRCAWPTAASPPRTARSRC